MPTRKPIPTPERARTMLENRHSAYVDMIEEYEPYCQQYPDDTWARAMLAYARKEVARLASLLGQSENRQDRPVQ